MQTESYRVIGARIPAEMLVLTSRLLAHDVMARYGCGPLKAMHAVEFARGYRS